ncbi:HECT-domain (ubiquitin-transferase) containing protein, putative, partial [Eimeria tenella]
HQQHLWQQQSRARRPCGEPTQQQQQQQEGPKKQQRPEEKEQQQRGEQQHSDRLSCRSSSLDSVVHSVSSSSSVSWAAASTAATDPSLGFAPGKGCSPSQGPLTGVPGSPSSMRLELPRGAEEALGFAAAQPPTQAPGACADAGAAAAAAAAEAEAAAALLLPAPERAAAIAAQQQWRGRAECMYSVLGTLRLLLSPRHGALRGRMQLLASVGPRLLRSFLYYFCAAPPAAGCCCCSSCSARAAGDPVLVQALFDAQGASWLLKRGVTATLAAATPENLRVVLSSARPQTLLLLLLALSRPRPQQEAFAAALLQVLEESKTGKVLVLRLLHETRAVWPRRGASQGAPGGVEEGAPHGSAAAELLPGCQFQLEAAGGPLGELQLGPLPAGGPPEAPPGGPVSADALAAEDGGTHILESLGIRSCGLRAVGAANSAAARVGESDWGERCGIFARRRYKHGRLQQQRQQQHQQLPSLGTDPAALQGACDSLSSLQGSGFWPFLSCLLRMTETQLKGALEGSSGARFSFESLFAAPAAEQQTCCAGSSSSSSSSRTAASPSNPRAPVCSAWGPCCSNGPCGGASKPLHGSPGFTLGVIANPRLVGLPTGAATGGEGCACVEMHRPSLWIPLQHRLQQLHDALYRREDPLAAVRGPPKGVLEDSLAAGTGSSSSSSSSSNPAARVAAHLARQAAELWLSWLLRRLQPRRGDPLGLGVKFGEGRRGPSEAADPAAG